MIGKIIYCVLVAYLNYGLLRAKKKEKIRFNNDKFCLVFIIANIFAALPSTFILRHFTVLIAA